MTTGSTLQPGTTSTTVLRDPQSNGEAARANTAFALVHWMGVQWAVPRDWSCIRHSCNPAQGGLTFADRTRPRLQLSWNTIKPKDASNFDAHRVLENYRKRTVAEGTDATIRDTATHGLWSHATRIDGDRPTLTRLLRLDQDASRVLEVTVTHSTGNEQQALASDESLRALCEQTIPKNTPDHATHWRLFDLDIRTPAGWLPQHINALPGDVAITFAQHEHDADTSVTARRQGLIGAWFDGDLDAQLHKQHAGPSPTTEASIHRDFHRVAQGDTQQPRWQRWCRKQTRQLHGTLHKESRQLITLQLDHRAASPFDPNAFRCKPITH